MNDDMLYMRHVNGHRQSTKSHQTTSCEAQITRHISKRRYAWAHGHAEERGGGGEKGGGGGGGNLTGPHLVLFGWTVKQLIC